jgi:hypothetical protein
MIQAPLSRVRSQKTSEGRGEAGSGSAVQPMSMISKGAEVERGRKGTLDPMRTGCIVDSDFFDKRHIKHR